MLPREVIIEHENAFLSPLACRSSDTKGRERDESPCDFRTDFQRDRDRIIHSNSFRRLKHKTQVFLNPVSEHYRTRLTHTLEVSQIARTIARALRLNEDLTEAIALGHDLGHTPFGHHGERTLDSLYSGGFHHNEQSVRLVEVIEKDGIGLNLCIEVRDGIKNHRGGGLASTLEGQVVQKADKIAYINHDIEDAIRGGILKQDDLPTECVELLGSTKSARITSLIRSVVDNSTDVIRYDEETDAVFQKLRAFMFEQVYFAPIIDDEQKKSVLVVERLYDYYLNHIDKMPRIYQSLANKYDSGRAVCDFISGMSDDYAVDIFGEIFIPKSWKR